MSSPADRRFSDSHEWFRVEGDIVTVGITQHAADELTDITYVEMKPAGEVIDAGDTLGEVESVKTTSDIYSVIAGEVIEVNQHVVDNPAMLNTDPYNDGWLIKVRSSDVSPVDQLMDHAAYDEKYTA